MNKNPLTTHPQGICRLVESTYVFLANPLVLRSVFRIVDEVVNEAYNEDKEYVRHLEEAIAERAAPVDVYDFAYEIIVDDEQKSVKIWNELYKGRVSC